MSKTKLLKKQSPIRYEGKNLLQIAMPLGGIGTGCFCMNGQGGFQDFSLRHRPSTTAMPDNYISHASAFATLRITDSGVTKLVEGPMPKERIYNLGLYGCGHRKGGHPGLPRFTKASFDAEYPFGHVNLTHPDVPLTVRVTGYNPFIPLDDKNSSIPCAIIEYRLTNPTKKTVPYELAYHLSHLAGVAGDDMEHPAHRGTINTVIPNRGVYFHNSEPPNSEHHGSACLMALTDRAKVKGMWFRGGWFDAISVLWREVSTGQFQTNNGTNNLDKEGRSGGSILLCGTLKPGESVTHPIVVSWHYPNSNLTRGGVSPKRKKAPEPAWQTYYAGVWENAQSVAEYVRKNYQSLRTRTMAFKDALHASTLPGEVVDAIASNLAILKSPTILRQKNGNIWGWEGCNVESGSCPGTCTHVWNYAQTLCHLFPALERSLREQELLRSMNEEGHINFRAALPDGPTDHGWHAAADGQLGGILKLCRDWMYCGDTEWLRSLYPYAKKSLDYCISIWDPDRKGALIEPHHNTYDIEFWGPDGMCTSIYIGALSAMSVMANALGKQQDAETYARIAEKGAKYMDDVLYNGEYYQQQILYKELRDQSFMQQISGTEKGSAVLELLRKEGPKYQYGSGCLSDGVIGAWMAALYGVKTPMNAAHIRSTLKAIFRHNFKRDLSSHANTQRPGYAWGDEPGLLLCTWPRGGKPTLPFVYSDEVWTGIEYQVASHLILEGFVKEGLTLVKAVRRRYDGHVRNPFNEYECGNYYARAMASYSLLNSLTGFRYSALDNTIHLAPKLPEKTFSTFFSTPTAWGTIELSKKFISISVIEGKLRLARICLTIDKATTEIKVGKTASQGKPLSVPVPAKTFARK